MPKISTYSVQNVTRSELHCQRCSVIKEYIHCS